MIASTEWMRRELTRRGIEHGPSIKQFADGLEAWAAELDETGDVTLEDYARLHNLTLDAEPYRHEFPEDAPFTVPAQDE
jgi:hypothetical protein